MWSRADGNQQTPPQPRWMLLLTLMMIVWSIATTEASVVPSFSPSSSSADLPPPLPLHRRPVAAGSEGIVLRNENNNNPPERHLYPRCSGEETASQVVSGGGGSAVLASLPLRSAQIQITCLAYDVVVESGECGVAHQTDLSYHLLLRARSQTQKEEVVLQSWNIRLLGAGSVTQALYTVPGDPDVSSYDVLLVNTAANANCRLRGRVLVTAVAVPDATSEVLPVLVHVNPSVLYSSRRQYTYFVLQHTAATPMSLRLSRANQSCDVLDASESESFLFLVDDSSTRTRVLTSDVLASGTSPDRFSVWKYYFDHSGSYQLCFKREDGTMSHGISLAKFAAYQGNPSYYTFEAGLGPRGQVYVGRPVTVNFHGSNLDTRPNGDSAKFVEESESCESGKPAGGVRVETDLGPADDFGPNTRFTTWTWTLLEAGSFRLCYRRKDHAWEEVLSRDEIASQNDLYQNNNEDTSRIPKPTDRISREACPMAPKDAPAVPATALLHFTIGASTVPSTFPSQLADVLCVPRSSIVIVRQSNAASGAQLWVDLDCDVGVDNLPVCSAVERRQYVLALAASHSPLLHVNLMVLDVTATKSDEIFGVSDPNSIASSLDQLLPKQHRGAFIAGICLTLVAVAALAVFAVIKYKEHQPYMIQFGLDEDDDEGSVKGPHQEASEQRYVPDATIEMELEGE